MRSTNRTPHAKQYELFRTGPRQPTWTELPLEVRETAARLMACLLRAHRRQTVSERAGARRSGR